MNEETRYDVIVIGSGLGGLLSANLLAREGMRVCVLEQHQRPGGCLQTFRRKGVVFDTGVHYFGGYDEGGPLRRYWNYFGIPEKLETERLDPDGFDIIGFPEGDFPLAMGFDHFEERLLPFFPDQKENLHRYTTALQEIVKAFPLYNLELPGDHSEEKYRHASAAVFFTSFDQQVQPASRIPLSAILAGNNLLYSGSPDSTPLHTAAVINHSFISGAWRTAGDSERIAQILVEILESAGGEIFVNQRVSAIHHEHATFTLTTDDRRMYLAANVIAAIHPAVVLNMMDPERFRPSYFRRIQNLKNTISSFAIHAILRKGCFPHSRSNYYYHDRELRWSGVLTTDWPNGYLLQTPGPAHDDGSATSLVILTAMPYSWFLPWENTETGHRGREYREFRQAAAGKLLALAERRFPGLHNGIELMELSTPLTWRDYTGIPEGSMYGIEHDYHDPLLTSVLPKTKIPGLFFTGQNINLHGMLGVTIGAVQSCGEIVGLPYLLQKIRNHG